MSDSFHQLEGKRGILTITGGMSLGVKMYKRAYCAMGRFISYFKHFSQSSSSEVVPFALSLNQ